MRTQRTFAALIAHDGVCLVEYRAERGGLRIVGQWNDPSRSASINEALARLLSLAAAVGVRNASLALAIEQFGVFHHVLTLPPAPDDVLRPVVKREVQRVFGVNDPVVAFTRGASQQHRRGRADRRTASQQLFIAGAPRTTIDALRDQIAAIDIDLRIATVVPKAMHSLYESTGGGLDPTAVVVCLESGAHIAYFLEDRLEMAVDPPIALEGERATPAMILDQVERGTIYFRQQFRGATPTRVLLAARADEYEELAATLGSKFGARVSPLFSSATSPEAVVAIGAVLEAQQSKPLDLFPRPPAMSERLGRVVRGPNGAALAAAAIALLASGWAFSQVVAVSTARDDFAALQSRLRGERVAIEPIRRIAERRADFVKQIAFVSASEAERSQLAHSFATIGELVPPGVRFDTLRLSRTDHAWSAVIDGQASGGTTAEAVHTLGAFYERVRDHRGIATTTLDQFDYPAPLDSAITSKAPVLIQFRISFILSRNPEATR